MRVQLYNYRGIALSQDTIEALSKVEEKATENGWRLDLINSDSTVPPSEGSESLQAAGRQVTLRLHRDDVGLQESLNAMWGHLVPLGFTPWNRYPIVSTPGDNVFHFFGPWRVIYDRLMSEGRGHLAWPSMCCASQVDVGTWAGDKVEERFVQAQLHRVGRNCGPVDGIIGPRTTECIDTLGLKRATFPKVIQYLKKMESPSVEIRPRQVGHIALPGRNLTVSSYGGVKVTKTVHGATLTVDGPGRVILDVGSS